MNWFKENPFLAGLVAVTLIGAGAIGYLLSEAMTRNETAITEYDQAVQKLHGLQARVPYPSTENLAKAKEVTAKYKADLKGLRDQLAAMEIPINPNVGPQQFQDDLRKAVNETVEKATAIGVVLPDDFYLGFRQYSNSLPSEQAAPALARQLVVIKQIVQRLIDFRVHSIDKLDRMPLPQEGGTPAVAAGGGGNNNRPQGGNRPGRGGQGGGGAAADKKIVERFPFDLAFTAEQSKFRVAFNSLIGTSDKDQYLIIRSVNLVNSNPVGPAVEAAPVAGPDGTIPAASIDPTAPENNNLNVILGRELVRATLRIELIDFADPIAEAK